MRDLYKGVSEKMPAYGKAEKRVGTGRLYDVYGLYSCVSNDGDSNENAGKESESKISE